jgi:C4-type Zn-finger protein
MEREAPLTDERPRACPRCGTFPMLYTPNARREPYATEIVYEPAWQCTRCGHKDFVLPAAPR